MIFREPLRISMLERDMPDQQKQFAGIAKKYHDSSNAVNDVANPAYRLQYASENWFGTAKDVWRMPDGRVALAVRLPAFETPDTYLTLLSGEELIPHLISTSRYRRFCSLGMAYISVGSSCPRLRIACKRR